MQIVNIAQGSNEWYEHRKNYDNASDAPAMMNASPYKTRADLLKERATGIMPDIDAATQRRFDDGHRFEALARVKAEEIIGEGLYPVVGVSGTLSASFDGLTIDDSINFEHKTINDDLRAAMPKDGDNGDNGHFLPLHNRIQIQQQMIVSGAEKTLFMASKWDGDACIECRWCWYYNDPSLAAKIVAGWGQFHEDLMIYKPVEVVAEVVAEPVESLPAVAVRVDGALSIVSNLDAFGERLKAFVAEIDMTPKTDQAFANAEEAVKVLQRAQDALEAAEANALAQVADVEILRRTVADYAKIARDTRLLLEKTVKARKEQIKVEIVQEGQKAFADHVAKLNERLGKNYMPTIATDFGGVIKGKKLVSSLREAVDAELARAKIEANRVADAIQVNLNMLTVSGEYGFLFSDAPQLVLKDPEAVRAIVTGRIAEHKAAEEKRIEAERQRVAQQERERIEREERAKIEAEVRAKAEAEKAAQKQEVPPAEPNVTEPAPTEKPSQTPSGYFGGGGVKVKAPSQSRPTDLDMVRVLAVNYRAHESKVVDWLKSIDFVEVNKQLELYVYPFVKVSNGEQQSADDSAKAE